MQLTTLESMFRIRQIAGDCGAIRRAHHQGAGVKTRPRLTIQGDLVASHHLLVGLLHRNRWILGSLMKFGGRMQGLMARSHITLVALDFAASSAPSSQESHSTSLEICHSMGGSLLSSTF